MDKIKEKRLQESAARKSTKSLAELEPGTSAFVTELQVDGLLYRRLLDLGFIEGTEVESRMASPAGDPIVYRVHGSDIALRKKDAALVRVAETPGSQVGSTSQLVSSEPEKHSPESSSIGDKANAAGTKSEYTIALAGNPNTGKSTVFNALTGLNQHVGNWPGKTVVRAEGSFSYRGTQFKLVDLPGTYSLLSTSVEEEVARDYVLFGGSDCTVIVVDATCLERNLNLVIQILEISADVVICLNLMDQAKRKGIEVDETGLEKELGVPVVPTSASSGIGLDRLREVVHSLALGEIETNPLRIPYSKELQAEIEELVPLVEKAFPGLPNARWIALRLIDGGDERLMHEVRNGILEYPPGRIGDESLPGNLPPESEKRFRGI